MRSRCLGVGLWCTLVLALPAAATDKKAEPDPKKDVDADKLQAGEFVGKLLSVPGTDGAFSVEVHIDHLELKNPNALANAEDQEVRQAVQQQQQLARLEADVAKARTIRELIDRKQRLANEVAKIQIEAAKQGLKPKDNPYKVVTQKKTVDFQAAEDVKVRNFVLPIKFDDKGDPKQYTEDEKKALKGKDAGLPGYEAAVADLKIGQMVKVTLAHVKPPKKDADKDKKDAKDPKEAADKDAAKKMQVTLILILPEDETPSKK